MIRESRSWRARSGSLDSVAGRGSQLNCVQNHRCGNSPGHQCTLVAIPIPTRLRIELQVIAEVKTAGRNREVQRYNTAVYKREAVEDASNEVFEEKRGGYR